MGRPRKQPLPSALAPAPQIQPSPAPTPAHNLGRVEVKLLLIKQRHSGPSWVTDSTEQPLLCKVQLKVVLPKRKRSQFTEEAKSLGLSVLANYGGDYVRAAQALIRECPLLYPDMTEEQGERLRYWSRKQNLAQASTDFDQQQRGRRAILSEAALAAVYEVITEQVSLCSLPWQVAAFC